MVASVLQCVAVCCSALQCVAPFAASATRAIHVLGGVFWCVCSECVAVCCRVTGTVCCDVCCVVCCRVVPCVAEWCRVLQWSESEIIMMISHCNSGCRALQRGVACCSVLPTAPAPRAVCRRCRHTPSCLSLSTPARPYLDDSGMPPLGCNAEAANAFLLDAHNQRHAALLAQHLHPCGPARVMCARVCVCV